MSNDCKKSEYDYLVVGAGLFGASFARLAKDAGKKVLVVEKRNHVGGNIYSEKVNGIEVHKYGAHIFHTNNDEVWEFVNRFASFNDFVNSPKANYKGKYYSLPFNMNTFHELWGVESVEEAKKIIAGQSAEITGEPKNLEEKAISLVGRDVFKTLVKGYTEKQWGRECKDLPPFIISRLPLRFEYNNNYFNAKYQGIPQKGYTDLIERMLEGIEVRLECDYLTDREALNALADKVVYTGTIDAYFGEKLGRLEYRTLNFEEQMLDVDDYQSNAVVNYTDAETPWTRIIEHKWFTFGRDENGQELKGTIIFKEYPKEWEPGEEPYYPVNNERNNRLYEKYSELAKKEDKVVFGGRLGLYKYFDMDGVIAEAMNCFKELNK